MILFGKNGANYSAGTRLMGRKATIDPANRPQEGAVLAGTVRLFFNNNKDSDTFQVTGESFYQKNGRPTTPKDIVKKKLKDWFRKLTVENQRTNKTFYQHARFFDIKA